MQRYTVFKSLMESDVACCLAMKSMVFKLNWLDAFKWLPWLLAFADRFRKEYSKKWAKLTYSRRQPSEILTLSEKRQNFQRFHNPNWQNYDEKCPYVLYKSDRRKIENLNIEGKTRVSTLIFIYTIHFA